ncbi:TolB family protein [Hymenobacter sp. PAMC 26628]|uniref:TolB family protein n=1 Tax=Hymenobacter sp. PAMC 26628 TaxID=1484118 RepID=UPI000770132D|nr:hypothetical protein [Hymenobacter sp. PAMC 26628]AMJ64336.1 hypothetical protein AXW84_02005 [Hymenobacter sp. PAMC 26628]
MRRLLLGALGGLFLAGAAGAQSLPVISQNPPDLRWREVRTPHFRVLYPVGLDSAAQRTAGRLEAVHGPDGATLGVQARPIAVVLQNQTTVSNGFVTFLPRHAEFFTTPQQGQGLGTVDWLDGLVVHEFRHVNQFDKARQGVGRALVPLLGDGALGVAAVGVPQWFFEGDAVGAETALTRSGRGRIPYFGLGLRANLLSGRRYNYQKAVNGSLRDNVPDWYVLGYFMTSYLKAHRGPAAWARVLDAYYRFPFYPFSFSNSIRRTAGLRVEALYARTMAELDSTWRTEQAARPAPTPVRELAGQAGTRIFTQYQYPQYVNDSTVLALKSGLNNIPQLVQLGRHGREQKVFTPGLINIPEQLSVGGGAAVWPEFRQQPRWGQRVYSELKILDLKTGRLRAVGRGGRFAAAALSPDGTRLVAVRTSEAYRHALVVLDARSGALLQTLPNPGNALYQQPRWLPDGRRVVAVTLRAAGKTLEIIDPATGAAQPLLPTANVNLTNPQPWGDYVLYNSPQTGVDNIYAVSLKNGLTYQVTNRPFGAYHAAVSPGGRTLAFHDYRATGARVVEMPLDPTTWTALGAPATADVPGPYAAALAAGEPAGPRIATLLASPDSAGPRYGVRRYRPLAHAFRVFSYGAVQSPAGNAVSVGVRSQDFLSTTQAFAGLSYDQTERTVAATGALSYQGRFPVLDVEASYGGRNSTRYFDRAAPLDSLRPARWQYARVLAGVRVPLVLTRSKYLQALTLGAYYLHERVYNYPATLRNRDETGPTTPLHALQTSLAYASQLKQSARDVAPRGGATLLATYRTTPFGTALQASQIGAQAAVYLPGLAAHHALRLRAGYQYQQQSQYNFTAAISYPRAETSYISFDRLAAASADYNLPLAFVHWSVGRVLYVQRLRADVFADVARGSSLITVPVSGVPVRTRAYQDFRNGGADLLALFNVFHLRTPVEAGVRIAYSSYLQRVVVQTLAFNVRL